MRPGNPLASRSFGWLGKGAVRILALVAIGAVIAGIAAAFGISHDYGYLHASILTGSADGQYHAIATRLADRVRRGHGALTVVATAGSIENVSRLSKPPNSCAEKFALIQDGTPVPAGAGLELLGRLPKPESLLLLGRQGRAFPAFADLRGVSIGIGPQGSGTAYLVQQLFDGPDLKELNVRLSHHELSAQAELVAQGKLDLAAVVIQEDAEFIGTIVNRYGLDIVAPHDLDGLIARYPWLSVGVIPAGRYDLLRMIPPTDKQIARLGTLVVANACAKRADRVALLMLLAAELPGFVRGNPPGATSSVTVLPLASEAHQFFNTGEPEFADRYFPWLVNLMSPAYWVYLVMAVTVLFNAMNGYSRFRLWRLDAAREKIEVDLKALVAPDLTHTQMREVAAEQLMATAERRAAAKAIVDRLAELRVRCRRQAASFVAPMGNEMFYRYQESLIDQAMTTLATLLQRSSGASEVPPVSGRRQAKR